MFKINWSDEAKAVYYETLDYWSVRNKSNFYSEKIIIEVEKTEVLIAENPFLGIETKFKDFRKIKSTIEKDSEINPSLFLIIGSCIQW